MDEYRLQVLGLLENVATGVLPEEFCEWAGHEPDGRVGLVIGGPFAVLGMLGVCARCGDEVRVYD